MVRRDSGPRRSESVDAYLRGTRALAAIALFALVAGVLSDAFAGRFWADHALLAGLVASVIVVMLTVGLVNEALERRSLKRWSVLAQYVMLQLVRDARIVWTGIAELAELTPSDPYASQGDVLAAATSIDADSSAVRNNERLTAALRALLARRDKRKQLHDKVTTVLEHNDSVLGRWAAVMLNADVYAEVIDRHVELTGDLAWASSLLGLEFAEDDGQRVMDAATQPRSSRAYSTTNCSYKGWRRSHNSPSSSTAEPSTSPCGSSPSIGGASSWEHAPTQHRPVTLRDTRRERPRDHERERNGNR